MLCQRNWWHGYRLQYRHIVLTSSRHIKVAAILKPLIFLLEYAYASGNMWYFDSDCQPYPDDNSNDDSVFADQFRFQFPMFEAWVMLGYLDAIALKLHILLLLLLLWNLRHKLSLLVWTLWHLMQNYLSADDILCQHLCIICIICIISS